jgi:hypothetical protein
MKKIILIGAAILAMESTPANAGSSFSLNFFSPEPVYYEPPPPRPIVYSYPVAYSYYYPSYRYVHYDRWHKKHHKHKKYNNRYNDRHDWDDYDDDNRGWRGRH